MKEELIKKTQIITIINKIRELKRKLTKTDYKAIKFAEGEISASDYDETKEQRKQWREEINTLEGELELLK